MQMNIFLPLIFRLLKALPSGNYRNILIRMVRSRLSSKELLESHISAHAPSDRDEARCVNAIARKRERVKSVPL